MFKQSAFLGLLSATFLVAGCAQPAVATAAKRQKLLLQMSEADPARWYMALNNAKNVQDERKHVANTC